jgi:hypothetical protein
MKKTLLAFTLVLGAAALTPALAQDKAKGGSCCASKNASASTSATCNKSAAMAASSKSASCTDAKATKKMARADRKQAEVATREN